MKRNQSIDLLKLISVFFIVIIHSELPSPFRFSIDSIGRFATPIFFMSTGYFIIKAQNIPTKLTHQMLKLTKYYIIYEIIYILYNFIIAILGGKLQIFETTFVTNMEYILVSPTFGFQLWYVINTIWVLTIIYFFNYFNKLKVLFIASIILHLSGIVISHLSLPLFHRTLDLYITRNFLFFGLFYVMIGIYLGKVNINKITINKNIILIFSLFMCFLQIGERYMWQSLAGSSFKDYFVTTIFASVGLFIYALSSTTDNKIVEKISKYSMPIYFLHVLVMDMIASACFHIIKVDIQVIKSSLIGNLAFILIVCLASCILYNLTKSLLQLLLKNEKA